MLASIINIVLLSTVLVVIFNHLYLCFNLIFFFFLNYVLCCVLIIPVILLIVMQHCSMFVVLKSTYTAVKNYWRLC